MDYKLSILVATTKSRDRVFAPLHREINRQIKGKPVELIINRHETNNVGKKRNDLLAEAKGQYVVFIDSDDHIDRHYVSKILRAIESSPDCVGISGIITTNGKKKKEWHISKDYESWFERDNCYYRTPNHISPIKREIALQAGFPEISHGEDAEFSKRVLPFIHTEVKISGIIYHYDYRTVNK